MAASIVLRVIQMVTGTEPRSGLCRLLLLLVAAGGACLDARARVPERTTPRRPVHDSQAAPFWDSIDRPVAGAEWRSRSGLTEAAFGAEFSAFTQQGYRPLQVDSYLVGGQVRYGIVLRKGPGPDFWLYHGKSPDEHHRLYQRLTDDGWRPVNLSVLVAGGVPSVLALYEKRDVGTFESSPALSERELQARDDANARAGRTLVYLDAHVEAGAVRFSAIWHQKTAISGVYRLALTAEQLADEIDCNSDAGLLTRSVAAYPQGGQTVYAALFGK